MLGTAQDTGRAARIQRVAIAMLATAASYFNAGGQRFESLRLPVRDAVAAAAEPNPRPATQPWTTQGGARFTGSFVRLEDGNVVIETDQGEVQELSFDELSQANQQTIYRNQDRWGVGEQRVWNVGGHIENLVVGWVTDYDPIRTVVTIATGTTGGVQHEVDWASLGANERRHVLDWDRKEQAGDEQEPSAPKPSRETGEESAQTSQPRTWTDIQGRTIEAQLVQILTDEKGRIGGIQVRLRDRLFDISLDNLSEEDREFVKELLGEESPSQISSTPIASQEELPVLDGMPASECQEAQRYQESFLYAVEWARGMGSRADAKAVGMVPVPDPQHSTHPSNLINRIILERDRKRFELYVVAGDFRIAMLADRRGSAIQLPEAFSTASYRPKNEGFYTLFVV